MFEFAFLEVVVDVVLIICVVLAMLALLLGKEKIMVVINVVTSAFFGFLFLFFYGRLLMSADGWNVNILCILVFGALCYYYAKSAKKFKNRCIK
ncbi:MAG: hypothetical protein PHP54_03045 [Clostridia bacterium]|nr:hypothetical protein [Clostridia bacterium]